MSIVNNNILKNILLCELIILKNRIKKKILIINTDFNEIREGDKIKGLIKIIEKNQLVNKWKKEYNILICGNFRFKHDDKNNNIQNNFIRSINNQIKIYESNKKKVNKTRHPLEIEEPAKEDKELYHKYLIQKEVYNYEREKKKIKIDDNILFMKQIRECIKKNKNVLLNYIKRYKIYQNIDNNVYIPDRILYVLKNIEIIDLSIISINKDFKNIENTVSNSSRNSLTSNPFNNNNILSNSSRNSLTSNPFNNNNILSNSSRNSLTSNPLEDDKIVYKYSSILSIKL